MVSHSFSFKNFSGIEQNGEKKLILDARFKTSILIVKILVQIQKLDFLVIILPKTRFLDIILPKIMSPSGEDRILVSYLGQIDRGDSTFRKLRIPDLTKN